MIDQKAASTEANARLALQLGQQIMSRTEAETVADMALKALGEAQAKIEQLEAHAAQLTKENERLKSEAPQDVLVTDAPRKTANGSRGLTG